MQTDDVMAIAAGGDVTLTGSSSGSVSNTFVGMIYTGGNLQADNLQLYGQFVANGGTTDGAA